MLLKNLLYIGNKLSKHGLSITTIETLGPLLEGEGYTVFYASSKKNQLLRLLEMIWKTVRLYKKVDYLLIDTYSTSNFWYAFIISQIARILDIKYLPILHGGNLPARIAKNPTVSKMLFDSAFMIVSPSKYLFQCFEFKFKSDMIYIPNSLEIKKYPFKKRLLFEPKLLWVRSFSAIYNPEMALQVLEILNKKYPNASLCMVGPEKDGSLEKVKSIATAKKLNVQFLGYLSKKEWIKISSDYDVFINTTNFDNMPVSIIEAMALGLPVVSTNVGGIPFLLEDKINSFLVDANDAIEMAKSIEFIVENPLSLQETIALARAKSETFDWEIIKNLWKDTLK